MVFRDVQVIITYTGGICGTFILFLIPLALIFQVRKLNLQSTYGDNFNKSPFQHTAYLWVILAFAIITLGFVVAGLIISGGGGGH